MEIFRFKDQSMIAILILHILFGALQAKATTAADRLSPCSAFKAATLVFIGDVASSDPSTTGSGQTISFHMQQWLTSQNSLPSQIKVSVADGACSMPFKAGETYLVFAERGPDGSYITSACAGSKLLENASEDLEMVESFSEQRPEGRVFGDLQVLAGSDAAASVPAGPIVGATVKATGPGGPYETTTDEDGHFRFTALTDGEYRLEVELPEAYTKLSSRIAAKTVSIKLPDNCGTEVHFLP
jgi:hypothetical protein